MFASPQHVIDQWVVKGALVPDRPDESPRDEVLEQQKASARAVELEWPPPQCGPREAWETAEVARVVIRELLYAHILHHLLFLKHGDPKSKGSPHNTRKKQEK